jgi:hypothetical protein
MTELHGSRPQPLMIYELGWATLPGLRGLACSDFRAIPTTTPDDFRGVAVEIATEQQRDTLLQQLEIISRRSALPTQPTPSTA